MRCTVPDCPNRIRYGRICDTHRHRLARHGDVQAHVPIGRWGKPRKEDQCRTDGCQKRRGESGYCPTCVRRQTVTCICGVQVIARHRGREEGKAYRNLCDDCTQATDELTERRIAEARLVPYDAVPWDLATCRGVYGLHYAPDDAGQARAKRMCATCPIRDACLTRAIHDGEDGVWGGLTKQDRRRFIHHRKESYV